VRLKLKSDKSFFAFLSKGGASKILPLLIVGILLFILGSGFFGESKEAEAVTQITEEERLAMAIGEVEGVGRCKVMTTADEEGEIVAAVVLCDGADSPTVRLRLTELISSLYGIRSSRIAILKMGK
jgi:hypothetical protein